MQNQAEKTLIKRYAYAMIAAWTLFLSGMFYYTQSQYRQEVVEMARVEAMAAFEKDVVYRRWSAMHGGVYAPSTEKTPPNPYLSHIPERDIITPSGRRLTLVNPAYMTRQVHEITVMDSGILGHITSLKPIRPENAPDLWEKEALHSFENGAAEASSLQPVKGKEYLRFMRPLKTEEPCLSCHEKQGYKVGDLRGGISVSVPMDPFWSAYSRTIKKNVAVYCLIWLSGLTFITAGYRQLLKSTRKINEEKSRYEMLFNNALDAIVLSDPETGLIIDANEKAVQLFGRPAEMLRGMHQQELHNMEDRPDYQTLFSRVLQINTYAEHAGFITNYEGQRVPVEINISIAGVGDRSIAQCLYRDMTELQNALQEIRTLQAILPICSYCRKIRDDKGSWESLETYISRHSDAMFSHGICAECAKKAYPDLFDKK